MFKNIPAPIYRGLLFILISVILTACGLPSSIVKLDPPTYVEPRNDPESGIENDLIFRNAYENGSNIFSGYEIYYKIYDPLDDTANSYAVDREKISSLGSKADYNTLLNMNFNRLFFNSEYGPDDGNFDQLDHSDSSYPSFSLETDLRDQNFRIRLIFLQDITPTYLAETYQSEYSFDKTPYFYRWAGTSDSVIPDQLRKGFDIDDFDINDDDMPNTIDDAADLDIKKYLYISFYIMSFGHDIENLTIPIYSVPVYLGTLMFDCALTNDRQ